MRLLMVVGCGLLVVTWNASESGANIPHKASVLPPVLRDTGGTRARERELRVEKNVAYVICVLLLRTTNYLLLGITSC